MVFFSLDRVVVLCVLCVVIHTNYSHSPIYWPLWMTCLGGGGEEEKIGLLTPACFLLDLCQTRVLLECPIDLAPLLRFLPTVLPSDVDQHGSGTRTQIKHRAAPLLSSLSRSSSAGKGDIQQDVSLPVTKRQRLDIERSTALGKGPRKNQCFKEIGGGYFLDAVPWYKTPDFNLVDVTSLNAVIISNAVAMLGLPFLVCNPDFTAKVYVTEATAKLGQLMMEELVALHTEFTQIYGRSTKSALPPWLLPESFASLQPEGREQITASQGFGEQWHPLYSTVDVRASMARVHRLHYGEEVNIDGFIRVMPSSSGFGIGSSNWVLKGAHRSLSYISTSSSKTNHAMPLDISALDGSQVLLFSHGDVVESLQDEFCKAGTKEVVASESISGEVKAVGIAASETHQVSEGVPSSKQSSQRMSPSPASSASAAPLGVTGSNAGVAHKLPSNLFLPVMPEKAGKGISEENEGAGPSTSVIMDERIRLICKSTVEALGNGGSVLIPIDFYGVFLELIGDMSTHLQSAGFEQVPIYYISPVAEELLAYANTVPEWLCPARQEKLFAGEALFGFVEALHEKRVRHFPALHSSDLIECWQEPCVVFATHWSLRVGAAVHLLQLWRNNPHCLLVLTEPNVDQQLVLAPFVPFTMQVLHLPVFTHLRSQDVVSIIQKLKPQLTLVPGNLKTLGTSQGSADLKLGLLWSYERWKAIKIPSFGNQKDLEVVLSADLALQIQLKQVKSGKVAAARLRGELHVKDGQKLLDLASPSTYSRGIPFRTLPRYQIRWGDINVDSLLTALRERGMYDLFVTEGTGQNSENGEATESNGVVIEIKSPSHAKIELSSLRINIHANEPSLRRQIVEVVNNSLCVL